MSVEKAEVQTNDTEMSTLDLANEIYDEMEAAEQESTEVETPEEVKTEENAEEPPKSEDSQEEKTEEPEALQAPDEWNADLKAAFEKQTPEGREALVKAHKNMYSDYQKDKQTLAQEKQLFEPVKQSSQMLLDHFNRHANELQAKGVDFGKYTAETVKWLDGLIYNPDKTLADLQATFGKQESQEWVSPEQEQLNAVKQELEQLKWERQQEQQTQQQQFMNQQKSQQDYATDQFRTATNADGSLKHPHFDDADVQQYLNVLAGNEIINLQKVGKTPQDLTPTELAESRDRMYTEAVKLAGKDVKANKAPVQKPERIKATAPVETSPNLTTKQIAEQEYDRMMGQA